MPSIFKRCVLIGLCAVVFLPWFRGSRRVSAQPPPTTKPPMQRIRAEDIGTTAAIVGRLGHDLGELVTIRGVWERPVRGPDGVLVDAQGKAVEYKDESLDHGAFVVTKVNGEKCERAIRLDGGWLSSRDYLGGREKPRSVNGDVWELRGVELGEYRGEPAGMVKFKYPNVVPQFPHKSGFYTYFYVLDYRNAAIERMPPRTR
jgi:hypothetical protein